MMNLEKFEVGQKFYYTGDMANSPDFGEIVEVHEPTRHTQLRYTCKFEKGKTRVVDHFSFHKSVGQRFKPIEQYNAEQTEMKEQLERYLAERNAK